MKDTFKRFAVVRRTLVGKLTVSYFLLIFTFGVLYGFGFYFNWLRFSDRYTQGLNWEVAEHLADDLAVLTNPELRRGDVEAAMVRFRFYNPGAEPYLVNDAGEILVSLVGANEIISVSAIKHFVEHRGYPTNAIFGPQPDPNLGRKPIVFSAYPILVEGKNGFVYVSLASVSSDVIKRTIGDVEAVFAAALFMIGTAIAAGLIGYTVFRRLTRRLRSMAESLEQLSKGRYDQRMPTDGDDELTAFATVLNSMADAISAQIEKLTQIDLVRRELVAGVVHDIRNPIAQIRVSLEAARDIPQTTEMDRIRYIDGSLQALESLSALIEDLFELSKLSAEGFVLSRSRLDLGELLEGLSVSFGPAAQSKNISLATDIPAQSVMAEVDVKLLSRALSNLIDNALQYSDPNTCVTLSLSSSASAVDISIRDQGPGFAADELKLLAQPFQRGRQGKKRNEGGTGLGLAIARKVIELHGGRFSLKNASPHGADIQLSLPRGGEPIS